MPQHIHPHSATSGEPRGVSRLRPVRVRRVDECDSLDQLFRDSLPAFGGAYPGGALYTRPDWLKSHAGEAQALTNAIVATLKWIHSHTAEEIMAKMPDNLVGPDKAGYLAALKNTIPMYSEDGLMDPKGASAVLDVFSAGSPDVANAGIDVTKTYTNDFVTKAKSD